MLTLLTIAATTAAAEPDASSLRSSSTVGAQGLYSQALNAGDVDLLVGERFRSTWTSGATRQRIDLNARLTLDPDDVLFQRYRLRSAHFELQRGDATLRLGRSSVERGGPRLVDGVQALWQADELVLGAWGGLAPDLFTTTPRLRPGGGPMVFWLRSWLQASAVGEVLFTEDGLDRAGLLGQLRVAADPRLETLARLDLQLADGAGQSGLADGAAHIRYRLETLRLSAFYNAYSSLRYLQSEDLDPYVRRFVDRVEDLDLSEASTVDLADPRLYHLAGVDTRWRPDGELTPFAGLEVRGRYHDDPALQFARVQPSVGVSGLMEARLEVAADANIVFQDLGTQTDPGVTVLYEPTEDRTLSLDASVRALLGTDSSGSGWYADLFCDWAHPLKARSNVVLTGGVFSESITDGDFLDTAVGGFALVSFQAAKGRRPSR